MRLYRAAAYVWLALLWLGVMPALQAQNLVPNPNFDTLNVCPIFSGTLRYAKPWWPSNKRSTDLLNRCSSSITAVPVSYWGNMEPAVGEGYAGIRTYQSITPDDSNYREYLAVPLNEPLEAGASYWVSFQVSPGGVAQLMTDDIGVHFSVDSIPRDYLLDWETHVGNPQGQILNNFGRWKTVTGQYNAVGGERYLAIGNFEPDSTTTLVRRATGGTENATYLFVDAVSVELCGRAYPDSLIQYEGTALCAGEPLRLSFDRIDSLDYTWDNGSDAPSRNITQPGLYTLSIRGRQCSRQDTVEIEATLPLNLSPAGERLLCAGETFNLSVIDTTVQWQWADGPFAADRAINAPGTYVLISETADCLRMDTLRLKSAPTDFGPAQRVDTLCEGGHLILDPGIEDVSYLWSDGSDSLTRAVRQSGVYTLALQNDCSFETLEFVVHEVSCSCEVFVPNVFTPNNDGYFDALMMEPDSEVVRFDWEIFDRWGRLVATGTGSGNPWDGQIGRKLAPAGVYFYSLRYQCQFLPTRSFYKKGTLTLLR